MNKSDFIWFNGKIVPWDEAKVHVMSHTLHYGSSVFEGIRCYDSYQGPVIFRHDAHIQRLMNSAKIYRMPIQWTQQELMQACKVIVRKNDLTNAYIRPLVFIGSVGMEIYPVCDYNAEVMIAAFSWKNYLGKDSDRLGIDVLVSSWNRTAANTMPHLAKAGGNYLSSMLISNEARRYGCDEGIGLDVHGYVSEGSGQNLFIVKDDIIFTPSLGSSILLGITRDSIIKLLKSIGLEIQEQVFSREFLYIADEVFMCGTASEIIPVRSVDGIQIGSKFPGFITKKLQKLFFGLFTGETQDHWNWLDLLYQ